MGLFRKFVNNTRKPEGLLGSIMIWEMNVGYAYGRFTTNYLLPDLGTDAPYWSSLHNPRTVPTRRVQSL